jgi:hypothetical protein
MSEYLTLQTTGWTFLNIEKSKCIDVELFLNMSENGRKWIKLGDKLYYFRYPRNEDDKKKTFLITKEQYIFIKNYLQTQ